MWQCIIELASHTGRKLMYEIMAVTKALSDETRVRMLAALEGRELCVCQLIELIEPAPSTVSSDLSQYASTEGSFE
jgi:DNA-binding transcriptional ArsR family regulator